MKTATIFLNGFYDTRHLDFYRQEIVFALENSIPLICADGGIRIFDLLNNDESKPILPDVHIGDMDSVQGIQTEAKQIIEGWVGQTDKDSTDGQLAVKYALETYSCSHIILYGGLPKPGGYETDHFLGNVKLMRFGHYHIRHYHINGKKGDYKAEMRDPYQMIHYVLYEIHLMRKNKGLQRVSLVAEEQNVVVKSSENLRWDLTSLHIHADLSNALRNEFVEGAEYAKIRLAEDSAPVCVIHNWYD